ncbi:MAG: hypothetical protein IH598_17310 [Bacteroidales bacterium]|nr:hypothetical protein [Bacteroidales bacterium]
MIRPFSIIAGILLFSFHAAFGQFSHDQLRDGFFAMKDEKCGQMKFFERIKSEKYASAVHQAYAGTAEAASAECASGPYNKIEYFNRGKKNIEAAVIKAPKDPEVRFMRFATQANIPGFLFYDNIKEDKALIIEQLPALLGDVSGRKFWLRVAAFMKNSGELDKREVEMIEKLISGNAVYRDKN